MGDNVHRLGTMEERDNRNNNNNGQSNNNQGGGMGGMFSNNFNAGSFFGTENESVEDPRKETFFTMLRVNICPTLRFWSFCT